MSTILVVDDSMPFRLALRAYLSEAGFDDIIEAGSAPEAFAIMEERVNSKHTPADIILTDLMMPGMDGIAAIKLFGSHPRFASIPVVIVSAHGEEDRILQAFEAGAVDFISKPLRKLELLARVGSVLRLKHEMDMRKAREAELRKTIGELEMAIHEVKTLSDLLPICASCKRIRNDEGYWEQVEKYLGERTEMRFTHGICPECITRLYPDLAHDDIPKLEHQTRLKG